MLIDLYVDIPPLQPEDSQTFESVNWEIVDALIRSDTFTQVSAHTTYHDGVARLRMLLSHELQKHRELSRAYARAEDVDDVFADQNFLNEDGTV